MVAWVVINHHRPRQSTPKSSSLRTLCLCVELSDAFPSKFPFVSHLPYVLPSCVSRNPFVCHSYENCRGVYQQFPFWNSTFARSAHYRSKIPTWSERDTPNTPLVLNFFSFRFLRTLLHFLYSPKTKLFSFQEITHSLTKTQGWGRGLLFFAGRSLPQRKQRRFSRRAIGNLLQLRILPAERLRHLYFGSFQDADELQRVDHRLTLEMIVGDDEHVTSLPADFADARNPRSELFRGVKIVIALVRGDRGIFDEPGIVAAAVQPHISDSRSGLRGGRKRSANDGLVDVAETGAAGAKQVQRFWRIPGGVPNFDHQRIVGESLEQGRKISNGLLAAMKRKWKLQQHRAQLVCRAKHIEARAYRAC